MTMLLVIDNYDSFTYNLVQYLAELDQDVVVQRNDQTTLEEIRLLRPDGIVISPGPCTPAQAGISVGAICQLGPSVPILGVCLGHQCIGQAFGGRVIRAPELMHGKSSLIYHDGRGVFVGLPQPFEAIRYHSLVVQRPDLPRVLEVTAQTTAGLIMGLRHRELPIYGVQFHPESIMTAVGKDLLRNFITICEQHAAPAAHAAAVAVGTGKEQEG
jgi:anthranilate synthase/aminodeoxychorismate synthase-like glutamine amidotransferase